MAGAGKLAVVATLMFALLLSASMVDAARPVVEPGSNVATDGRTLVREGRQLRLFGCWFGCGYPHWYGFGFNRFGFRGGFFNNGGDVRIRNDKHRRLNGFKFFGGGHKGGFFGRGFFGKGWW